jgi:2-oxo-4-hydroxy-4-carboxy-5-ureidoimidazoline decarboxylase
VLKTISFSELNEMAREEFATALGAIFEDSPWVAERAWSSRPFGSLDELCDGMNGAVLAGAREEQQALLRAHPDLGTRARIGESSTREQAGVGLDRLTPEEYDRLLRLNAQYKEKFGFPFLYAVKGSDKHMMLDALETRLGQAPAEEFEMALKQVFRIARFRLEDMIR